MAQPKNVRLVTEAALEAGVGEAVNTAIGPGGAAFDTVKTAAEAGAVAAVERQTPSTMFDVSKDGGSLFALRLSAQIAASASQVLLSKSVSNVSASSSSNVFSGAPGTSFSFVAVGSKVLVEIQGGYVMPAVASSAATLELNLRTTANVNVPGTMRRIIRRDSEASSLQSTFTYQMELSGLSVGQTYNYAIGIRNADGNTGSVGIRADDAGPWGPLTIKVTTVPSAPVSDTAINVRMSSADLPGWAAAKSAQAAGTRDAKILCIGDSTMAGFGMDGPSERLVPKLVARGLAAAPGGSHPRLNAGSNPRYSAGAGWPDGLNYGLGSQGWKYDNPAGKLTYADPAVNADSFDVYYVQGGGATGITLQIDNETAVTYDGTGSTSTSKITIASTSASKTHALKITAVGTGAILFVEPWLSTAKRIRVANAGVPSTNSLTWASGIGIYSRSMISAYQPDVIICLLGANDSISAYTAEQVVANISTLASAAPDADFIVLSPIPCKVPAEAELQQQYALRERYATAFPFVDQYRYFVDWETADAAGWMSDLRHPNADGMEVMATLWDTALALP